MFIDIHAHVYKDPVPFVTKFYNPKQLLESDKELGIEKTVLLPVVNPEIYFPQSNEEVLEIADAYPDHFIPFCNIDPRALTNSPNSDFGEVLEYYKKRGCKGLGEVMPNMPLMHPKVQNLLRYAEIAGLPVIYDGSDQLDGDFGLYDEPGLPQLEHTLQRFPNLKIFGHGPTFWAELGELETPGERGIIFNMKGNQVGRLPDTPIVREGVVPKLFRRYKNLLGDLSDGSPYAALMRSPEYGAKFLTEFQDRLFFGTDRCCVGVYPEIINLLKSWKENGMITETVFNKITYENAAKLFGLKSFGGKYEECNNK